MKKKKNINKSNPKSLVHFLKKQSHQFVDQKFQEAHDEVFEEISCLSCANCCKTLGPRIINTDIKRISRYIGTTAKKFQNDYLKVDEDNDWVFKQMPCYFLEENNECKIYDVRPSACRTYPHTDTWQQKKQLSLHLKNLPFCPAVEKIFEKINKQINS
ncbi:MAG: zinc/iron-chelating domain-containing protein [Crocinitomicaceae bacterium]|nr:zinc/iron-chelating domain-containing protein [Crocinitomicaceae bacterium]|tara:strand:- start:368 stop:841 length:474 start_codon:yes stop_codon:yes gene_type:complete